MSLLLCRERKEDLSQQSRQTFSNMLKGADGQLIRFRHTVTREVFEDLIRPHAAKTVELVRQELEAAARDERPVDTVVLVGGSTRVPLVQRMLREALQKAGTGIELRTWEQQDAAVALGTAYAAHERWPAAPEPRTAGAEKPPPPARATPVKPPRGRFGRALAVALCVLALGALAAARLNRPSVSPPPPPPPRGITPPVLAPGVLTGGVWRAHIPAGPLAGESVYDFRPDGSVWDTHFDPAGRRVGYGSGWYTRTADGVEIQWSSGAVERGRMVWHSADAFRYEIVAHHDVRQIGLVADYYRSRN